MKFAPTFAGMGRDIRAGGMRRLSPSPATHDPKIIRRRQYPVDHD